MAGEATSFRAENSAESRIKFSWTVQDDGATPLIDFELSLEVAGGSRWIKNG